MGVCQINSSQERLLFPPAFNFLGCGVSGLIGISGLSRLPLPAIPGCCGIELVSLATGSLFSKGSLGLAEGEAAGLTFLQWFSNISWVIDMLFGQQVLLCSEDPGASPWLSFPSLEAAPG